jgi:hypothetical protein
MEMRKPLSLVLGLLALTVVLAAQDHDNMNEKAAKGQVIFTTDVRVGTTVLQAGEYDVTCDTKKITFTRTVDAKDAEWINGLDPITRAQVVKKGKKFEFTCKGKELNAPAEDTFANVAVDQNGGHYLDKLYLRGSKIEHTFQ